MGFDFAMWTKVFLDIDIVFISCVHMSSALPFSCSVLLHIRDVNVAITTA